VGHALHAPQTRTTHDEQQGQHDANGAQQALSNGKNAHQ
jgi:hypothetical protein